MQNDLNQSLDDNDLRIDILGCNVIADEANTPAMVNGRTLPWLQDIPAEAVWDVKWKPVWRDVVILDENNNYVGTYNLTTHDLGNAANYQTLLDQLLRLARRP